MHHHFQPVDAGKQHGLTLHISETLEQAKSKEINWRFLRKINPRKGEGIFIQALTRYLLLSNYILATYLQEREVVEVHFACLG